MSTTRTRSPYFSPNSIIAPIRRASSIDVSYQVTSRSSWSTELISSSISASAAGETAPVGEVKSKRSRPGAFSEPAWAADGPSALRTPACTRWVPVCARAMAARRAASTSATTAASRDTSPAVTVPRCTRRPATGDCTSSTRTVNEAPRSSPWSACWPPASA